MFAGGFLCASAGTLSIGVVAGINAMMRRTPAIDALMLLEVRKERYEVYRILEGSKIVENSAHVIPEVGYDDVGAMPPVSLQIWGPQVSSKITLTLKS